MAAWLLPLASFVVISIGYSVPQLLGLRVPYASQRYAAYVAVGAIVTGFVLSMIALVGVWLPAHPLGEAGHHAEAADHAAGSEDASEDASELNGESESHAEHNNGPPPYYAGDWYTLAQFGALKLTIGYYIDTLTVVMFCVVTLIAAAIHIYAIGYMHDELDDYTDHEVTLAGGQHLTRRGRFHRFFQYFSLFSFSMLGICIAGNLAMVFVFWELVGICSYFLIGFYIERHSATTAGNKAFIVNRVGDFGMLIGLMAIWSTLGTFSFGDVDVKQADGTVVVERGIFSQLHDAESEYRLAPPEGMSQWLLFVAGVGIFCGCMGKSAQFPLHTWLPDAMEGPTPVSALVHSATMVAAGVFLVGRVYPIFTPEALLVIAVIGCTTLFIAATIAITATDIKRVLAYSTVSQLGYMMLGLGVGGWAAGLFHLITHAFFKALLFLCSGSVIHAAHTNEMPLMGGLRRKMPITCLTTLAGVIAITGLAIPIVNVGFAGFYSKDAILAQSMAFVGMGAGGAAFGNGQHYLLFLLPLVGAGMTAFYMFRLFFMTFTGEPRDHHVYDHAHESPKAMWVPLAILAACSVFVAWPGESGPLYRLIDYSRPVAHVVHAPGAGSAGLAYPALADVHAVHHTVGFVALLLAAGGAALAYLFYGAAVLKPDEVARQFRGLYQFLLHKWRFDELYDALFIQPAHRVAAWCRGFDLKVIDGIVDGSARATVWISKWDGRFDLGIVDGLVNLVADWIYAAAAWLRVVQTGSLRQYVMFIALATVGIFAFASYLAGS
jgi:NADH-quinone oxidoreductase subunit L